MGVEENSKTLNKNLYIVELKLLKIIPSLVALIYFINTILSTFGIDIIFLSDLGSMSIISLIFMYVSSYVFKFCEYHRLPLHYIVCNNILSILGYKYGTENTVWYWIVAHIILVGICLFAIIYLYLKSRRYEKFNRSNP